MIFHLVFSWSSFLSWVIFIADLVLIALLTLKAYKDAEILDRYAHASWPLSCIGKYIRRAKNCSANAAPSARYEVPFFGRIASRFLDDE
jgi:hypothetical protein